MITLAFDLDDTLITDTDPHRKWFGTQVKALPGALYTLRWCRQQGYRVALYSMGDLASRLRRLDAAGIPRELFDGGIYAVPAKTPEEFNTVLGYYQQQGGVIMIGDSWKRDVAVSLGRSLATVWVQGDRLPGLMGTPPDPEDYPVWIVRTVADLPNILPQVLANPYRGFEKAGWENYWWGAFGQFQVTPRTATTGTGSAGQLTLDLWSGTEPVTVGANSPSDEPFPWDAVLSDEDLERDGSWSDEEEFSPDDGDGSTDDAAWPATENDRKDLEFVRNPPPGADPGYLAAYERREICGCGDHLLSQEERADGICETCKVSGDRTPGP